VSPTLSPEDGNGSSFQYAVFFSILDDRQCPNPSKVVFNKNFSYVTPTLNKIIDMGSSLNARQSSGGPRDANGFCHLSGVSNFTWIDLEARLHAIDRWERELCLDQLATYWIVQSQSIISIWTHFWSRILERSSKVVAKNGICVTLCFICTDV
jgi:hypothetical protein